MTYYFVDYRTVNYAGREPVQLFAVLRSGPKGGLRLVTVYRDERTADRITKELNDATDKES